MNCKKILTNQTSLGGSHGCCCCHCCSLTFSIISQSKHTSYVTARRILDEFNPNLVRLHFFINNSSPTFNNWLSNAWICRSKIIKARTIFIFPNVHFSIYFNVNLGGTYLSDYPQTVFSLASLAWVLMICDKTAGGRTITSTDCI